MRDLLASYPHRLAGHCGSGSLRDLLEFHGLDFGQGPLGEGACFGFGGGLSFLYSETPGEAQPLYVVGRTGTLEEDVAAHLGLGLEVRETEDPAEGWATVREELTAGRPPMVWADIGELEYLRVRLTNTRHDVVVVGYDEAEGVAWLADNDREELQPCSLASLARARSSSGFPGPNRHRTYLYRFPEALPPAGQAIRAALGRAVGNMRGGDRGFAGLSGTTGLVGLQDLAASYPEWPERFGPQLDDALGVLRVLIVKAGTGGAMFRSLQADFLHEAAALLDDDDLTALGTRYDVLAEDWVALAAHAGAREHAAGLPVLARLLADEEAALAATEAWLAR